MDEISGSIQSEKTGITVPHEVKLAFPVTFQSKDGEAPRTMDSITIERRPTARDLMGLPASGMTFNDNIVLVSRITGKGQEVIKCLDASDFLRLTEVIGSFLQSGR